MCSSPQSPNRSAADLADRLGTLAGWGALLVAGLAVSAWGGRRAWAPDPGEMRIHPETILQIALAPAPEMAVEAPPELPPEPEPFLEPVSEPEPLPPEPVLVPEPMVRPDPPPEPPPPVLEAAPSAAAQPVAELEGEQGAADAIRAEWLGELRRRIERRKYYPGAARYAREAGTVRVRVEVGADGRLGSVEIVENTGSARLEEGARGLLRRVGAEPLGTNALGAGFRVEVPITYRIERW
jgi:periplasmic protein TonB